MKQRKKEAPLHGLEMGLRDHDVLSAADRYFLCESLLSQGKYFEAEMVLSSHLDKNPGAAQSLYLLGICLLLQGNYLAAGDVLRRAYEVKIWIRDFRPEILDLRPVLREALAARPDWAWANYELQRNAFFGVGMTFRHVAERWLSGSQVHFVEVGANDGEQGDPILPRVRKYGWSGLLVEPQSQAFEKLQKTYEGNDRVALANVAIDEADGIRTLYFDPNDRTTLSSFTPERNLLSRASELVGADVQTVTFKTLFEKYPCEKVDLLQIDTEGYDYKVLKTWDFERFRPLMINMEYYCLEVEERLEALKLLHRYGYAWRLHKMDLVAVDREVCERGLNIHERNPKDLGRLLAP